MIPQSGPVTGQGCKGRLQWLTQFGQRKKAEDVQ